MAKANLCCRMGERVMILLAEFDAHSFEDLFQGVKAVALEALHPERRRVPRQGLQPEQPAPFRSRTVRPSSKKRRSTRLGEKYGLGWLPETGATYQLRFSIMKDQCGAVSRYLRREPAQARLPGREANLAPLHETMAAAMVNLARYRGRDFFWDPFCGSGTICIEAAMIALNRAPGLNRSFAAQKWGLRARDRLAAGAEPRRMDQEFRGRVSASRV